MNTVSIWILILAIAFFLWIVVPFMLRAPVHAKDMATSVPSNVATPEQEEAMAKEMEKRASANHLKTFYRPASSDVPEDYPVQPIGTCPYTKPEVTALPVVDVPRCVAVTASNHKLI